MQGVAAAVSLGVNAGVIAVAGPLAAGFALAGCYAFLLVLHAWWNRRGFSMKLCVRYEWSKLSVLAVVTGVMAAFYLCVPAGSIVSGFVRGVAGPVIFAGLIWVLLSPGQRRTFLEVARRRIPGCRPSAA